MAKFTIKEVEDYLTSRLGGISVIDINIEYPDKQQAFHVEGENEYFLFEEQDNSYHLFDGAKKEKLSGTDVEDFLSHCVHIIANEEDTTTL
ncbi:MAG: hypothetical protein ACK5NA_01635 [Enterococcus sp.]